MTMHDNTIRPIIPSDDEKIAEIIKSNLRAVHLDIPGTAYFDPGLNCLSRYYNAFPDKRAYFIATDPDGTVVGGVGVAGYDGSDDCAEIQKLYLVDAAKGKGLGRRLMRSAEDFARKAGYHLLYLETHTDLKAAIRLYEKLGFQQIDKPATVIHSTMDRFYMKKI